MAGSEFKRSEERRSLRQLLAAIAKKWFKKGSDQPANWAAKVESRNPIRLLPTFPIRVRQRDSLQQEFSKSLDKHASHFAIGKVENRGNPHANHLQSVPEWAALGLGARCAVRHLETRSAILRSLRHAARRRMRTGCDEPPRSRAPDAGTHFALGRGPERATHESTAIPGARDNYTNLVVRRGKEHLRMGSRKFLRFLHGFFLGGPRRRQALPPCRCRRTAADKPATATVNTTGLAVTDDTVTVGQLHSVSGTMALSETGSVEAERLAISQINEAGGVLGRKIKIVQEDGASDWPTFAEKAAKLLEQDKCAAVFGCWTSASRKAVLPVFEKDNGMLYYPTFYEGLEASKNVIYTGQEATQQIIWGLNWANKEKGCKTFFLIGSDYIWPRTSNKIARFHIERYMEGCRVVGEEYYPLGYTEFQSLINKVKLARPNCIYSIIVGGLERLLVQAAQGGRRHRGIAGQAEANPADDLDDRGRNPRHRRRERRRLLRLHEVLPEPRQRQQQGVRRRLQGDVGQGLGHRRREPGRVPRSVAVEGDRREGRQLRHRQGGGCLARRRVQGRSGRLRPHPQEPPPVVQGTHRRDAGRRPVRRDRRIARS